MTIALIDQFPLLRMGLATFLNSRFKELPVKEYESVASFYHTASGEKPGLIILGLNNIGPEANLEILTTLRQRLPSAAILVYDDETDTTNALRYLRAGAAGYLSKSNDLEKLEEAIGEVLKGKRYIVGEVFNAIIEEQISSEAKRVKKVPSLTRAEYEVADYLTQGLKTKEIAKALNKKVSTISTFKFRIFTKLGVENVIELNEKMRGGRG